MGVMGRPRIELDWDVLDRICQYTITAEDAAFLAGPVSIDTLSRKIKEKHGVTFKVFRDQRSARTRLNLFNKQVEVALKGNTAMLIWLGKNYLGQSDKLEQKTEVSEQKLTINFPGGLNADKGSDPEDQ